jgi:voltage-gated potassium channel
MKETTSFFLLLAVFLLINLVGSALFMAIEPVDFTDAFYLLMTTSTTVGYGNVSPNTKGGKIFMSFYQLFPVCMFFAILRLFL